MLYIYVFKIAILKLAPERDIPVCRYADPDEDCNRENENETLRKGI